MHSRPQRSTTGLMVCILGIVVFLMIDWYAYSRPDLFTWLLIIRYGALALLAGGLAILFYRESPSAPPIHGNESKGRWSSAQASWRTLNLATDEKQMAEGVLEWTAAQISSHNGAILAVDEMTSKTVILAANGVWRPWSGRMLDQYGFAPRSAAPSKLVAGSSPLETMPAPNLQIPIEHKKQALGALWVRRGNAREEDFSSKEREILSGVAALTGEMLNRIREINRLSRAKRELTALRHIDRAMSNSLSLAVTGSIILDQAVSLLQADAAVLWLYDPVTRRLSVTAERGFKTPVRSILKGLSDTDLALQSCVDRRVKFWNGASKEKPRGGLGLVVEREQFGTYVVAPLIVRGDCRGVLEVFCKPVVEPLTWWMDLLDSVSNQAALAVDSSLMYEALQKAGSELTFACDSAIEGFARAVELHTREADGHSARVGEWVERLADACGISGETRVHLRRGALLHDVGKIAIPDQVLLKDGALSAEDWEWIRRHPELGAQVLEPVEFLRPALDIPKFHHERWDGTGYPHRLSGSGIPVAARIFSVVDVWDSLLSPRPYRKAWSVEKTKHLIQDEAGKMFDPDIARTFLEIVQ